MLVLNSTITEKEKTVGKVKRKEFPARESVSINIMAIRVNFAVAGDVFSFFLKRSESWCQFSKY